jgi:hypothetical protein
VRGTAARREEENEQRVREQLDMMKNWVDRSSAREDE